MQSLASAGVLLLPAVVVAQTPPASPTPDTSFITTLIGQLSGIINLVIPIVITLALLLFLWGLVKFMTAAGDETAQQSGKKLMIWGIVILFVMVTVWGLVALLNSLTGIGQGGTGVAPQPVSS
jgi:succinate dehydrogenase/fumarate reductase cytochrome b subunit